MEKTLARRLTKAVKNWWLHLLVGIFCIVAGVWIFMTPLSGFVGLAILFATVMLVSGFFEIFFALINRGNIDNWGWYFAGALFDFVIGVVLVFYPKVTLSVLPWIVAIWLLSKGFSAIAISLGLKQSNFRIWRFLLIAGIATIVFSILIIANPILGGVSIGYMTALAFISNGIFRVILAFKLRRLHDVLEDRFPEGLKAV